MEPHLFAIVQEKLRSSDPTEQVLTDSDYYKAGVENLLDHPETVTPTHHYGVESRLPWADIGGSLRTVHTRERW